MRVRVWIILTGWLLLVSTTGYAGEEDVLYSRAIQAARSGRIDFAFMYYNQLDRDYPRSRYREQVLLARGEYFYELPAYIQAKEAFEKLLEEYPQSPGKLFILAYLYKIAEADGKTDLIENLKKEILTFRQVGLVFEETKEYKYPSPFYRNFRAVFYIDKVEFYRGGELFATVSQ
jgi:outer membrane protein assembly factor BamD (BamD/ComL family)